MIIVFKILLIASLILITIQDFRERRVSWVLFPVYAVVGSYLFVASSTIRWFLTNVFMNIGLVTLILFILYTYARFILKKDFFKEVFGLGDLLFFIAFSLSFSTLAFINFFFFSILATLVFWIVKQKIYRSKATTIPLAGCMSLFLIFVYFSQWLGEYTELYAL